MPRHLVIALLSALLLTSTALSACDTVEEGLATSPLIGATRIEAHGEGLVEARLQVRNYTYLRLSTSSPGVWHVVSGRAPALGAQVRYRGYAELHDFHSPSLDRSFDRVIFSSIHTTGDTP